MQKISFVIPCYGSQYTLEDVVKEIEITMKGEDAYTYEIILINDGSPDNVIETIKKLVAHNPHIVGINLSKNFGQHAALMAGFHIITGDIVVCLDDDGQTPANEVMKLLDKITEGFDVVYASYDHKQHSAFRNWGSRINSKMTEIMLDKPIELNITSYIAAK